MATDPNQLSNWRSMSDHIAHWGEIYHLIVAVFAKDDRSDVEVLRVRAGEHGALFQHGTMLSIHEEGWIPFAWREDDTPVPDDAKWPPLCTDYLTEARNGN